ncbi:MAG: BRCT domain-containing protein, partial [Planctomycetota bacterium]
EEQYTKRRDELQNTSDDITKELTKQTLRYRRRYEEKRKLRDRLETEIVQIREELQRFMVRDLPEVDMGHDGIVLTVDIESRQAVINVGRRQGIKCGMRFEAFQFRQGNRRVRKGYLVVRSAGRETANCIIVNMAIRLPRCPGDGYTARYPEERFCPFCTGSAGGARVQRLSAIPKETNLGMDPQNPIVAGDLIQNPLYESGRELHFAVKGDTESPLSDKWKTESFIAAIKWHGGLVDADLTAQTDVLLAGKYAMDETRRARELGVRVLHQYEVFDFLRQ